MNGIIVTMMAAGAIVAGILMILALARNFLHVCEPNEILVFSGRQKRNAQGQVLGYRVIYGGRAWKVPFLEKVESMDMTTMKIKIDVRNAYSKGNIKLNISAIANVKISSDPVITSNAIERFLGRDQSDVAKVAGETLAGNLREVLATMTPEEVNEDRLVFAQRIAEDVRSDLERLGMQLDTLKIQSVEDDQNYLETIGKKEIARVHSEAEIAEAKAQRQAATVRAESEREAIVARTQADAIIQKREQELAKIVADLDKEAQAEEVTVEVAADEARSLAQQELQTIRSELERLRLQVLQVLPAEAERQASELRARGDASELLENARAAAQVNDMLAAVWSEAGEDAGQVFVIQQLEAVLKQAATLPDKVKLYNVHLVDGGSGQTLSSLINAYPSVVHSFLGQLRDTLGIDIVGALTKSKGNGARPAIKESKSSDTKKGEGTWSSPSL